MNVAVLFGIPTQLAAVGGLAREYAILFVPNPTATTIFPYVAICAGPTP
jgi:hypothetical protein